MSFFGVDHGCSFKTNLTTLKFDELENINKITAFQEET